MNINEPWNTYPRPQLKRESYFSLNGEWLLNQKTTIVPYPPQSSLSQYQSILKDHLHYEKDFELPNDFYQNDDRVILHFGAVDQIATIYLNHHKIGKHEGGYLPFSFDITDFLIKNQNHLVVDVIDNLSHDYPYGKQTKEPKGMWYTPVSGIWQTVWIERVPKQYIQNLKIKTTLTHLHLEVITESPSYSLTIHFEDHDLKRTFHEKKIDIDLSKECSTLKLWTPDSPYLYYFEIDTDDDHIQSYFALREISIRSVQGIQRICLNNEPIFLHGVLDQGYFHDGIFLPFDPQEYANDIIRMKSLGINLLRKHIKIEPEYFYYMCDQLGILVMQDMVNNGGYSWLFDTAIPNLGLQTRIDKVFKKKKRHHFFIQHMKETLSHLYNHPCIIAYTIFNEGWGQFNADEMYDICKEIDPSRIYDATSGWFWRKKSDVESYHVYFKNKVLKNKRHLPIFLSECGGYTRAIQGHMYNEETRYGYGHAENEDELTDKIITLFDEMVFPSIPHGLCGCIYTQLSDVETEINGLYTFDRKVCKVNQKRMKELSEKLMDSL